MKSRFRLAAVALALTPLAAACGATRTETSVSKLTAPPHQATTSSVPVPIGHPERIVSLSPSATEDLFAIGAAAQVVAVDSMSNYPDNAPKTDLSAFEPNVEAIAKYRPDLVVTDGTNKDLIKQLNKLGIAVFEATAPRNLSALYAQIESLGAATGNIAAAGALSSQMQTDITAAIKSYAKPASGSLKFYYELDNTFYSASSRTFIGAVMNALGMRNIADGVDSPKAQGYPQLTPEYIVKQNPDVIFLADTKCCQQDAQTVSARPGWDAVRAVKEGHIVTLDDDIASRWGPRVLDLIRTIVAGINGIQPQDTPEFASS
jgi:iron complex transport system substrate-binding protein